MDYNKIKPIDTKYNGYRFRSRLEARWAVFFDAAEIHYEYELEGYEMDGGIRYLPDFYLPAFKLHVEIKPDIEMLAFNELEKIDRFSMIGDNQILLIFGSPTDQKMYVMDGEFSVGECAYEYGVDEACTDAELLEVYKRNALPEKEVCFGKSLVNRGLTIIYCSSWELREIADGLSKAKKARFEFKK